MNPGNSSWLPWTSSERLIYGLAAFRTSQFISGLAIMRKGRSSRDFAAVLAHRSDISLRVPYFVYIFNQVDLGPQRLSDSPRRNAVTLFVCAAALRSTALATSLAVAVGLSALAAEASAKSKVPLPKPRPIARNV